MARPAMRNLPLAVVAAAFLSSCGVSTLEMSSDAERGLTSHAGAGASVKDDGPPPVADAGVPGEELGEDAGTPVVDAGVPLVDAGTPVVDAGIPVECESGETSPCATSCGSTGLKDCVNFHWGSCRVPAESCDNGSDDDCDGRVDHRDTDCTPIIETCEGAEGGGCNGDLGYGDHCSAQDNDNGCSASRFNAWCNRRNPQYPDIWDNWVHDWVSTRCDGNTAETGTQYSTWYCRASSNTEYRCTTPLVLSFDGAPVRYEATSRLFSFTPGQPVQSDWPAAVTPWLARDVDGNGRIDDGSELFGSNTKVPGGTAKQGFEALAALDANGDGALDARDPAFPSLRVWRDTNGDRLSQPAELTTLAQERVQSLGLKFSTQPRCDARGNCERERSTFTWGAGQQGSLVDVYLRLGLRPGALTQR